VQQSEVTGKEAQLYVKLPNGRIKCAYSTLHKHSIPELCRYQLIYELGFWIISNSHYSDGYIIRIAANDVRLFKVTDYTLRPYRSRIEIVLIYLYGTILA
jgi:hypothetical protein